MESLFAVVDTSSSAYELGSFLGIIIRSILFGAVLGYFAHKRFQNKNQVIGNNVRTSAQDKKLVTYITLSVTTGVLISLALYFFVGI